MSKTLTFATGPVQLDDDGAHLRRELGRALSDGLGVEVEIVADPSYSALADRVARGDAALAWLPPATFVRASEGGMIDKVYSSERAYGARYQAALFVRADGPIHEIDELRGKRVAWVDRDSCAGYLFPKLELTERGQAPDALFARQHFAESHMRVVRAVRDGECDAGATFVQLRAVEVRASRPPSLDEAAQEDLAQTLALVGWAPFVAPAAMRALLVSRSIPADALCITKTMPTSLRDAVKDLLLGAAHRPKLARLFRGLMNADRFALSDPSAYEPVKRAMHDAPG
ncbi:MAG: PhnD/SsuA/transferrin family substrate-binding protein [Sandaracinaceae bacterium]|nr:PhnD/SsuA/transferrin family substrate-binding protein [Sandaracinaceae bacterium]